MSSQINILQTILASTRTVFTVQSLMMLTNIDDSSRLTKSLHYYTNEGKISNPRRGIYTKRIYDVKEMACSLFRPSYISLEYVLQRAGVVFQWDDAVTCVSYLSRTVEVNGKHYQYRKISPDMNKKTIPQTLNGMEHSEITWKSSRSCRDFCNLS